MKIGTAVDPVRPLIHQQRDGQPQERRCREVNPDVGEFRRQGVSFFAATRSSQRIISAVQAMVSTVLTTSATEIGSHSSRNRARCTITPTPAGTKSNDRCCNRPFAV